jgi:acyl CoA:acetate/3-ketoacid CoA transferase beta subunit
MDNKKVILTSFEVITEVENGALIGGFSTALTQATATLAAAGDNTVAGCETNVCPTVNLGNCVKGCGVKQ